MTKQENSAELRPVTWTLSVVMAMRGIRSASELRRRLVDVMGDEAPSVEQVRRLTSRTPDRLTLRTLAGLCEVLEVTPGDLLIRSDLEHDEAWTVAPSAEPALEVVRNPDAAYILAGHDLMPIDPKRQAHLRSARERGAYLARSNQPGDRPLRRHTPEGQLMNDRVLPSPRKAHMREIQPGVVFSIPDDGDLERPSVVVELQPIDERVCFVRVRDLDDLDAEDEPRKQHQLRSQLDFLIYDVTLEHHFYKNVSDQTQTVQLGRRIEEADPGDVLHFTDAVARPDLFSEELWEHKAEPVAVRNDRSDEPC